VCLMQICDYKFAVYGFFAEHKCRRHAQKGGLEKKWRPVFWPAQALASDCQTYSRILFHPDGSRLRDDETVSVTPNEIAIAMRCRFYILGWMDESLESLDGEPQLLWPPVLTVGFKRARMPGRGCSDGPDRGRPGCHIGGIRELGTDSRYWINYLDLAWKLGIYGRYSSRLLVGTRLLGWELCEWLS
jgi:hypothetical protein